MPSRSRSTPSASSLGSSAIGTESGVDSRGEVVAVVVDPRRAGQGERDVVERGGWQVGKAAHAAADQREAASLDQQRDGEGQVWRDRRLAVVAAHEPPNSI